MNNDNLILNEDTTLSCWLMYWLETYIRPVAKASTYESYRGHCEKHIIPELGDTKLKDLTSKQIQQFFNKEAKSGNGKTGGVLSPKTIRNMRVVLDVALKQALGESLIYSNPIPLTVIKSARTKKLEVMTDDEQGKLEEYLVNNEDPYHPAILFDLYTGIRRGELCALRWNDYDETGGRITIDETVRRLTNYDALPGGPKTVMVFNDTKTESSYRELYLPVFLQDLIREQRRKYTKYFGEPKDEGFIFFARNGNMIDPDNLQHHFINILRKLGLGKLKFHTIRHTFATRAIENGIDVSTVSGILGHSNVTTTTRFYVHPREKAMANAMANLTPIYKSDKIDRLAG